MEFKTFIFYFLAVIMVFAALRVITSRNPVQAALFFVLTFFNAAGIWLLLNAEFLAMTLVLVYVGAVMVLFLFVVMMLDINLDRLREGFWSYLPVGALVGIFLNRKNLIVLMMAIELMLLAVNMNFVAFSHYLGDLSGQVFVFFILTVAAAESAIGLAILVVLFRNLQTIHVDDLDSLKG